MTDERDEILSKEFDALPDDLQLAITLNPDLQKIKNGMDFYADKRMEQLLEWMALNDVDCDAKGAAAELTQEQMFYYKGSWITKEELIQNFL